MFHQLFFLSAALLVSAQGPPPPASASGCTSKSFTTPSWLVDKFKVANGDVSFFVFNRASNATSEVACKVSGSSWSACASSDKIDLDASIQLEGTTANLKVNETWICKDREGSERLSFSASGSSAIALTGSGELTSKNPVILIRGTLSSPVSAKPAYLEGPTGHDTPGCRATSQTPTWVISSAHFEEQGGDGITSVAQTGMSLVMTNPSNGYQVSCMADNGFAGGEADPTPGGPLRLACAGYEFQSFTIGRYSLSTSASFDPATLKFNVGQTWYCDDTDPGRPVVLKGEASEILPLQCTTKTIEGNFTRRTCEADKEITVKGKLLSEDPLPAFSIEDPVPSADGCTISSIFKPQWSLSAFTINNVAAGASASNAASGVISFNIILQTGSRGFQYPIEVSQGAAVANSPGWYKCEVGPDGGIGQPLWPYDCTLRYVAESKELTIKADWACEDLDKEHPVHFSGVTTTIINSSITCESEGGLQSCHTADPGFSWVADIANVTVKAAP